MIEMERVHFLNRLRAHPFHFPHLIARNPLLNQIVVDEIRRAVLLGERVRNVNVSLFNLWSYSCIIQCNLFIIIIRTGFWLFCNHLLEKE